MQRVRRQRVETVGGNGAQPSDASGAGVPPSAADVVIVGSGFGGLGAAIRLKQSGVDDFVVLERADDVGGTWRDNTYPGCQCDVPSNLYSFSFAPKPDWTHAYPIQPQIQEYLRACADAFGVREHCRFGCEVLQASWDDATQRWAIETTRGPTSAKVLVCATGLLSDPAVPALPGLDTFAGTAFHSAGWDHAHDLTGERVAVIGTGASAIQFVPRIQPQVERLYVFQRTPPWVLPHPDRPVPAALQAVYRTAPALQRLARAGVYWSRELNVVGFTRAPAAMVVPEAIARWHLRRQVSDRELRDKLTPTYRIGCKRILLSDAWYPAVSAENAELITARIVEITRDAIVTDDGTAHPVDTLIFGTGFKATDPPIAHRLRGRGGQVLADAWSGSPEAYLSTTVAGFPNLFLLHGPNIGTGHTSVVFLIEAQIDYVLDALRTMRQRGVSAAEVRADVQRRWNEQLEQRLSRTVWNAGGCASWYLDRNGRNSTLWPDFTFHFKRRTARFEPDDYELSTAQAPAASG